MLSDRWAERCNAQRVHFVEKELPPRFTVFGFVVGKDTLSVYPVGSFEVCGEAVIYPPQTLNPTEDEAILAASMGLARMWDGEGVLTLRFAKQRDGADFALLDVDEAISAEAQNLLTLHGLWDGEGASFLKPGEKAPELLELTAVGVSEGETLHTAGNLREALMKLPDSVRAGFTGWYEKILRHDG